METAETETKNDQVNTKTQKKNVSDTSEYNFSVITVGTGTPKFSEVKSDACTIIQYNGGYYLVDCGDGSNRNLDFYVYYNIFS